MFSFFLPRRSYAHRTILMAFAHGSDSVTRLSSRFGGLKLLMI